MTKEQEIGAETESKDKIRKENKRRESTSINYNKH